MSMNILHRIPPVDNPKRSIVASNVQRGEGDVLAICSVKVGGVTIHGVKVRRGRQGATYVNLPSIRIDGKWVDAIEITSTALGDAIRNVVLQAAAEVTR